MDNENSTSTPGISEQATDALARLSDAVDALCEPYRYATAGGDMREAAAPYKRRAAAEMAVRHAWAGEKQTAARTVLGGKPAGNDDETVSLCAALVAVAVRLHPGSRATATDHAAAKSERIGLACAVSVGRALRRADRNDIPRAGVIAHGTRLADLSAAAYVEEKAARARDPFTR